MDSHAHSKAFDLAALLAPVSAEDFFGDHWERKPLHLSRKDPHYYDAVLTNGDLESIISYPDLRYPAIQLARDGGYLAPEAFTRNIRHGTEIFSAVADLERIQSEYRTGATVALPALHRSWIPVQELCAALENDISHPVHANAYLTPGGFPGFTPHYDAHEVFVLQIAGTKHWRVFDPPLTLPHRSQTFSPVGYDLPAPILEIDLHPGDLLYLPRGYVHGANAVGGHSAHLTIGITVYTWVELIAELANAAKDMPALRAALPPGFAARAEFKTALEQNLLQCLDQLRANADFQGLIDGFVHRVASARARPQPVFDSDMRALDLQTRLRTPAAGLYRTVIEPRGVVMEFAGKKFVLPDKIRTTIEEMCRLQSFRLADLSGPLDDDGKLTLARYLQGERFLTVLD